MKINKINKKDILFTQEYLDSDIVKNKKASYTNNPLEDDLPVLVEICGKFLVVDGHHRISSVKDKHVYCACTTTNDMRYYMRYLLRPNINVIPKIEAKNFIDSFSNSSLAERKNMMGYLHLVK